MPATRPTTDRATKESGLLDAAEALFLGAGYDGTTVAAVARRAGVTANTVYWYFPSKDHVLAAVLDRWVRQATDMVDRQAPNPDRVVAVVLSVLRELEPLLTVIHQRAAVSPVLRQFHERFHQRLHQALTRGLAQRWPTRAAAELAADVLVATVEGALQHRAPAPVLAAAARAAVGRAGDDG